MYTLFCIFVQIRLQYTFSLQNKILNLDNMKEDQTGNDDDERETSNDGDTEMDNEDEDEEDEGDEGIHTVNNIYEGGNDKVSYYL